MNLWKSIPILMAGLLLVAVFSSQPEAYERYQDGCNAASCHGDFTSGVSQKGSVFPNDNKHTMHRSNSYMNTECNLCHTSSDGNNPFIGSSDGTASNPGLGCSGCHNGAGLRLHHDNNGVTECYSCHDPGFEPPIPAENVVPPYYGTVDTNVDNPCNPTATANQDENWTAESPNLGEGTDNDGDNLYDQFDPDCGPAGTPGEANTLIVDAHDKTNGIVTLSYVPACGATENSVEYGDLAGLPTSTYSGRVCAIGNTGSYGFTYPAGDLYFLIVADDDAAAQGSYGLATSGERTPDGAGCFPQDLAARCD